MTFGLHDCLCFVIFILTVGKLQGQSQVPVIEGVVTSKDGRQEVHGYEGRSLTVTCTSELDELTLMYNNTFYNETTLNNGSYSVNFTIMAVRGDDGQNITCQSVNSTDGGEYESWAVIYLSLKPTDVRLEGVFSVEENDNATFTCTSIGSRPAPDVTTFYINNAVVNKSSTVVYDNTTDTYTASVTETRMIDRGYNSVPVFCYVAMTNLAYTSFDSKRLEVHYGPDIGNVQLTGGTSGDEGYTETYKCNTGYTNPVATINWFNGSVEIFPPNSPDVVEHKSTQAFYIRKWYSSSQEWKIKFSRYHKGTVIKCVVLGSNNKSVTVSKTISDIYYLSQLRRQYQIYIVSTVIKCVVLGTNNRSVTVTKTISDIYYKPELEITGHQLIDNVTGHYIYNEGETLNLTCTLLGANPITTVTFSSPGTSGSTTASLIIPDIKIHHDNDFFYCSSTNSAGYTDITIRLDVQYGPHISSRRSYHAEEGGNITLECIVTSNPPATVWWEKEGDNSTRYNGNMLDLTSTNRDQGGSYICYAASDRKSESGITQVISNETFVVDIQYGPGSSIRLSPNITSIELDTGTQVPVIRCIADCNPECQYTWYFTSGMVKTGSELNLGNASSYWHIGEVKCKAKNNVFRTEYTAYINFTMYIRHPPSIEKVDINSFNWYSEGSEIIVTCDVESYPQANITWYRNNMEVLTPDTYYTNETTTCQYDCSTKGILTIEHAECLDHRSHYTCKAENIIDQTVMESHNFVSIQCYARPAHDNVYNFTLREGEGINLTANYLSIPTPSVIWYFKRTLTSTNRSVYVDSSYGGQENFYYISQYEIKDIKSYDFGQYLAVANNYVGNVTDSTIIFNIFQDKTGWPLRPFGLEVRCTENSAEFSWISAYNGGSIQTFTAYYSYHKPGNNIRGPEEITDTGEGTRIKVNIQPLDTGFPFFFTVSARNINGTTESGTYVNCTTSETETLSPKSREQKSSNNAGVIAGAVIGAILFIVIVAVVGFIVAKRIKKVKGNVKFADLHLSFYKSKD
ncbi:hemicentin-1-like [Mytilus trossulus]|uniref:hemicentin-1-like n=1 Tax=Mytilus trossulus TaxID=6551 RepID=UPI003007EEFB